MNRLLKIGFQPVGHWKLGNGGIACELSRLMNNRNVLYAFVFEGDVKYIGKTTKTLKSRMSGYEKPSATQRTNLKNKSNIRELLLEGKSIEIFALPDDGLLFYGDFHINLAAGLEDSLISEIKPEWNGQRLTNKSVDAKKSTKLKLNHNGHKPNLELVLHKTYFNQGFFNIPVEYDRFFGADLDKIDIYCGAEGQRIVGYINRSANLNQTPRIMGGADLKNWFQNQYRVNDRIRIDVLAPNSIKLTNT